LIVVKRNGREVEFDRQKIVNAIDKAFKASVGKGNIKIAEKIADEIEEENKEKEQILIADIEQAVHSKLIKNHHQKIARTYEGYRAVREYQRERNTIDQKILGVVKGSNDDIKDNSNKNVNLISTMRDLVAEEVSKDVALRMMLPPRIAQAHNDGIIYIHDLGHYLNPSFNCCLVNLDDMLQNGTVINNKMICKPHSFRTACTIATQIIAQVASGQFGGQTITLAHLAPFVRISEENIRAEVEQEFAPVAEAYVDKSALIESIVQKRLTKEIRDGIQTFQYQINTLQTSNGQAPFLSVLMYIEDGSEYETETAMLVEEMLQQRIKGMQNKVGAWITPAFPKLLYVTDENNIHEDSKYFYITELAAKCNAKRMMPDCLSGKILRENYGDIIPPMGKRILSSSKTSLTLLKGCVA